MRSKVFKATVTVYHAAGRSKVTTADELRLDQQEQHPTTVTVGRLKLKICDLIETPKEANGKVSLVWKRHRIIAPTTSDTQDFLASVDGARKSTGKSSSAQVVPEQRSRSGSGANDDGDRGYLRVLTNRSGRGSDREVRTGPGGTATSLRGRTGNSGDRGTDPVDGSTVVLVPSKKATASARKRKGGKAGGSAAASAATIGSPIVVDENSSPRRRDRRCVNTAATKNMAFKPSNTLKMDRRRAPPASGKRRASSSSSSNNNPYFAMTSTTTATSSTNRQREQLVASFLNSNSSSNRAGRRGQKMVNSVIKPRGPSAVYGSRGGGGGKGTTGGSVRGSNSSLHCVAGYVASGPVNRSDGGGGRERQQHQQGRDGPSGGGMPLGARDLRDAVMGDRRGSRKTGGSSDDEKTENDQIFGNATPPPSENMTAWRHGSSDDGKGSKGVTPSNCAPNRARNALSTHSRVQGIGRSYGQLGYLVYRDPLSGSRAGFRNMGNTCYINACLQGLLSLDGFMGDLQRKCWVLAMLKPESLLLPRPEEKNEGNRAEKVESGSMIAAENENENGPAWASLYDALLRLSLEAARGSHGVMDAAPLKRAMDRHSNRFAGNLQQDAHEFLNDLINVLHEETHPRLETAAAVATAADSVVLPTDSLLECEPTSVTPNPHQAQDKISGACGNATADGDGDSATTGDIVSVRKDDEGNVTIDLSTAEVQQQPEGGMKGKSEKLQSPGVESSRMVEVEPAAAAAARKERFMPTTRHFHAEVEMTLTCTRCAYSRRRKELYRDLSLDIPEARPSDHDGCGLDYLLDGFFRSTELNLKCERCNHDTVRAEHSLAALPGTLIVHIKRFKAVVQPSPSPPPPPSLPASTATITDQAPANDSLPAAVGGESKGPSNSADGGGGGGSAGKTRPGAWLGGGVSYVKTMEPVSVPLELDLERFCTEFTGNAPSDDLGQRVGSLEAMGISARLNVTSADGNPVRLVSPPAPNKAHNRGGSSSNNNHQISDEETEFDYSLDNPTEATTTTNRSHSGSSKNPLGAPSKSGARGGHSGGIGGVRLKRFSAEISVDLSLREGWDGNDGQDENNSSSSKRQRHRGGGEGVRLEDRKADFASPNCPFRVFSPGAATREGAAAAGVLSGSKGGGMGVEGGAGFSASLGSSSWDEGGRTFLGALSSNANVHKGPAVRQAAKELKGREAREQSSREASDRWKHQEQHKKSPSSGLQRHHPSNNKVHLDSSGNIDYLQSICTPHGDNDDSDVLGPTRSLGGRAQGSREWGSGGACGGGDGSRTNVYARKGGCRRDGTEAFVRGGVVGGCAAGRRMSMLETDAAEEKELQVAIAASREEVNGSSGWDDVHNEEDHLLAASGGTTVARTRSAGGGEGGGFLGGISEKDCFGNAGGGSGGDDDLQKAILLSMVEASLPTAATGEAQKAEGVDEWACMACTFYNTPSSTRCDMCGEAQQQHLSSTLPKVAAPAFRTTGTVVLKTGVASSDCLGVTNSGDSDFTARRGLNDLDLAREGGDMSRKTKRCRVFADDDGDKGGLIDSPRVSILPVEHIGSHAKTSANKTKNRANAQGNLEEGAGEGVWEMATAQETLLLSRDGEDDEMSGNEAMVARGDDSPPLRKQASVGGAPFEGTPSPSVTTAAAAVPASSPPSESPPRVPRQAPLRARYQLRSVLHHLGRHAFAGHYVTDVRDRGSGAFRGYGVHGKDGVLEVTGGDGSAAGAGRGGGGGWKRHNDSLVSPVSEATALEGAARRSCYICFYSLVG